MGFDILADIVQWLVFGAAVLTYLAALFFGAQAIGTEGMPSREWGAPASSGATTPEGRRLERLGVICKLVAFALVIVGSFARPILSAAVRLVRSQL